VAATISRVNYWPDSKCARAFWGQQDVPPYKRLLAHTSAWLEPKEGERWLDLGCGSGQLTQAIWTRSRGAVSEVIGLDCAAVNETAFRRLREGLDPRPGEGQIRFVCADFSSGLAGWEAGRFDGVVSGLAIQYAESFSEERSCWTTEAYEHLLAEIHRVLRPGGTFVFSVNVPEPSWGKVALRSLRGVFSVPRPARYLQRSLRMMRYGSWLKREARTGRFHFLPDRVVVQKLSRVGFVDVEHRTSYAGQAYLFRCRKD